MGRFAVDHIQRQHRSCKRIRQRLPGCINKQLKAKLWDYLATGWWYMMIIWSTGDDDSIIIGSFFRAALGTSFYNYKWLRSCSDKIIMWQIKSYQCETNWSHLKVDGWHIKRLHIEFHILLDWQRSTRALFMFCSLVIQEGGGEEKEICGGKRGQRLKCLNRRSCLNTWTILEVRPGESFWR